jgi:crotonobetainyl-CoA:carnitine CoA-transferase CaiB-like acyl-CoA transferase
LSELAEDPRFDTNPKRLERRDELLAILDARVLTGTVDEWVTIMEALDVPLAPVNTLDRLLADPQVAALSTAHLCAEGAMSGRGA